MFIRNVRFYAFVILLSSFAVSAGCALEAASRGDIEAVRNAEEEMREAIVDSDLETLERLWKPDFIVNAPRNVVVPNREAVLEVFRAGIASYDRYEQTRDTIRVIGDQALVMGGETVRPAGEDAPHAGQIVHRRYTHVWESTDAGWRLAIRHAHIKSVE